MRWVAGVALGALGLAALAGCERGASAPSRAQREEAPARASEGGGAGYADRGSERSYGGEDRGGAYGGRGEGGGRDRASGEPAPLFKGKPMWADNRKHTAKENAEYQCDKHGSDIGARGLDDCVAKVHAFVSDPPAGTETATRVRNGDRLMYDGKANLFAVARKDGAPRTFFKPREGADYWREQKAEAESGRRSARRGGDEEAAGRGG